MEENKNENEFNMTEEEFKEVKKTWIYKSVILLVLVAILVGIATYFWTKSTIFGTLYKSTSKAKEKAKTAVTTAETLDSINDALNVISRVVDSKYIGKIDSNKLIDETVKGFISGLDDEFSEYMTKEEWEEFKEDALGKYVGVGIYMTQNDKDEVIVYSTIDGGSAKEAGIKKDDVIVAVDGESVTGLKTEDVSKRVKGEENTEVTITIRRDKETIDYKLTRKNIKIYHVKSEMLDDKTGYISMLSFDEDCADEFEKEMDNLINNGAKKVIFDLRYNTGGLVDEALEILDLFVDKDAVTLITKGADGKETKSISKNEKKYDIDLVILVNNYSASASEIVTGALKDYGIAKIVGTVTYGKGVIQAVYSLEDGSALKLTTDEYYTPKNNKINKVGITPDYEVELTEEDVENGIDSQLEKAKEVLK